MSKLWDEYYVPSAYLMKRTMPDPSLTAFATPFRILFGRNPGTILDDLVAAANGESSERGEGAFMEKRRETLGEIRHILVRR